jgi:hypothetical protein
MEEKRRVRAEYGNLRLADIAYAIQDIRRLEKYARGDWTMMVVEAALLVNDLTVGRGVVHGVESDCGDGFLHETWSDMMEEALREAEANLSVAQRRQANRLIDEFDREHHIGEERVAHRPEETAPAVPTRAGREAIAQRQTTAGLQQWNLAGIPPASYGDLIRTWEEDGFRVDLYDTGRVDAHGRTDLAYRFWDGNELLFEGEDFANSPQHATDSDQTLGGLLFFLSIQPGDTDDEYFRNYTPRQMEWARSRRAEELSLLSSRLEGDE